MTRKENSRWHSRTSHEKRRINSPGLLKYKLWSWWNMVKEVIWIMSSFFCHLLSIPLLCRHKKKEREKCRIKSSLEIKRFHHLIQVWLKWKIWMQCTSIDNIIFHTPSSFIIIIPLHPYLLDDPKKWKELVISMSRNEWQPLSEEWQTEMAHFVGSHSHKTDEDADRRNWSSSVAEPSSCNSSSPFFSIFHRVSANRKLAECMLWIFDGYLSLTV